MMPDTKNQGAWPITIDMASARIQVLRQQLAMTEYRPPQGRKVLERELDMLYNMYPSLRPKPDETAVEN